MGMRVRILVAVVAVVVAAWSVFWWFAASTVDSASAEAISKAGDRGIAIDCPDKKVGGWPFRMTVACGRIEISTKDFQIEANGLRAAALAYNPSHLVVEADSPAELAGGQLTAPVSAQWESGRASFNLSRDMLDRASFVFTDLALDSTVFSPLSAPTLDRVEVHLRRSDRPEDLDVSLSLRAVTSFLGPSKLPPFDADLLATIADGGPLLAGRSRAFFDRVRAGGGSVDLTRALLRVGDARIEVSGRFVLGADGHVSGDPRIAIANAVALGRELGKIPGVDLSRLQPVLAMAANFGEKTVIDDSPANAFTLTIRDGRVTAGLIPLGRLQPVSLD